MYDDNVTYRVGINWKDILIKLIMLILFVIILLLLFPKANLDVFYDNVYSNNVNTMKEAARNYYTVDRLPSNVGDKTSMTLKEMYDDHMLIRFTDKDGKTCDETKSYVEVTKISKDEYTLKVQLKCGEQEDYILETIGCTTVCSNGNCNTIINNNTIADSGNNGNTNNNTNSDEDNSEWNEVTEDIKGGGYTTKTTYYQHRKKITSSTTIYTCPEGYIKNGTKCTKTTTSATIDATPHYNPDQVVTTDAKYNEGDSYTVYADYIKTQTGVDYSCPTGYTLNGTYCIKYTSATEVPGEVSYTCPTGYTKNGTKCTKTYDATYTPGKTTYSCPNGGTLSGTKCVKDSTTYNAVATDTKYGSWVAKGTQYYTSAGKAYQSTTSWLQLNGMITGAACGSPCGGKGTWYKYTYYERSATIVYGCPNGGTLNGTKCVVAGTSYNATASTSYTCPNGGTRDGSKCTLTASPSTQTVYSCPSGYTKNGSKCTKTYAATANTGAGSYSCPNGGTLNGSKCTITRDADKVVGDTTYTCPSGYTYNKSNKKCEKKITATATPEYTYTCPTGYTKTGSGTNTKCYKVVQGQGNYYCEDASAVLNGTKCVKTIKGGISHYTCPTDYTLNGTKCSKTTSETIDATKEVKTSTSYKYKWSKYSKLEGWEFTGKTKVVEEYKAGQK